jgi:hypothetical protein
MYLKVFLEKSNIKMLFLKKHWQKKNIILLLFTLIIKDIIKSLFIIYDCSYFRRNIKNFRG